MAYTQVSLPAPAANGSGAAVDVSTFGPTKTITVKAGGSSVHKPSVIIEASNESAPTKWAPLAFFAPDGEETIDVAVRWMRATVTNYREGSAPVVEVGGNDDGTEFASIPVPSGNGDGAGVDVDLPLFKSVHVAGAFRGSISILISQDAGATYQEAMTFLSGQSGIQSKVFAADYMKVRRDGVPEIDPGSPVVNVGACSIGGGGGGGGGGDFWTPQRAVYFDDFVNGANFIVDVAGTGTVEIIDPTGPGVGYGFGVVQLSAPADGDSATINCTWSPGSPDDPVASITVQDRSFELLMRGNITDLESNAFYLLCGGPNSGFGFYANPTQSPNWQIAFGTDTGVPLTTNPTTFRIVGTAGGDIEWYIDDNLVHSDTHEEQLVEMQFRVECADAEPVDPIMNLDYFRLIVDMPDR